MNLRWQSASRSRLFDTTCSNGFGFICQRASGLSDPTPPATTAVCPDNTWQAKGDKCYKIAQETRNNANARSACTGMGAKLVEIRSFQESLYVDSLTNLVGFQAYVSYFLFL